MSSTNRVPRVPELAQGRATPGAYFAVAAIPPLFFKVCRMREGSPRRAKFNGRRYRPAAAAGVTSLVGRSPRATSDAD